MTVGIAADREPRGNFASSVELERIFAGDGPLAHWLPAFRFRPQQVEMASAIARAIETRSQLLAEAGTGTGKTLAYLVPALLSGGKVVISTGTKTLQDQLYQRDLPLVRDALKVPVSVALLTSTRDNCLGGECPQYAECFVMNARKQALAADVVVINHHLFFADVMLRDEGLAELLPACNTVILDEAHQLPETATLFFGEELTGGTLSELEAFCGLDPGSPAGPSFGPAGVSVSPQPKS